MFAQGVEGRVVVPGFGGLVQGVMKGRAHFQDFAFNVRDTLTGEGFIFFQNIVVIELSRLCHRTNYYRAHTEVWQLYFHSLSGYSNHTSRVSKVPGAQGT